MQNKARMKLHTPLYPHWSSVDHCNRPQSEETNFVLSLSKCPHFDSVIFTLVLALNAGLNTPLFVCGSRQGISKSQIQRQAK